MRIIGLTGKAGAGKGTAVSYIMKRYGAVSYRFSNILKDILVRIHKENSRENQANLALKLRELFGNDILARILKKDIEEARPPLALIDGIRYAEEYDTFAKETSFKLIAITAPPKIRYKRIKNRGEKAGELSMAQETFERLEKKDTELFIPRLIKRADARIDNSKDIHHLYSQIDAIVQQWN